MLNKLGDIW